MVPRRRAAGCGRGGSTPLLRRAGIRAVGGARRTAVARRRVAPASRNVRRPRRDLAQGRCRGWLSAHSQNGVRARSRQTVCRSGAALGRCEQQHPDREGARAAPGATSGGQGVGPHQHRVVPPGIRHGAHGRPRHRGLARAHQHARGCDRRALPAVFAGAEHSGIGALRASSRTARRHAGEGPGSSHHVRLPGGRRRTTGAQPPHARQRTRPASGHRAPRCRNHVDAYPSARRDGLCERCLTELHDREHVSDDGDHTGRPRHVRGDVGADVADGRRRPRRGVGRHVAVSGSQLLAPDAARLLVLPSCDGAARTSVAAVDTHRVLGA